MSSDLDFLFINGELDPVLPFVQGSDTSKAAAKSVKSSAGVLRVQVLHFLEQQGLWGATDEEVQLALSMNPNTERPRRIELVVAGAVKDSGQRRSTTSGRKAAVWVSVPDALQDGQRVATKAKGETWKELRDIIKAYSPEDMVWLLGILKQKDVLQAMSSTDEIQAQLDLLDADDG